MFIRLLLLFNKLRLIQFSSVFNFNINYVSCFFKKLIRTIKVQLEESKKMENLEKRKINLIQLSNEKISYSLMTSSSWSRFKQRIQNIEILEKKENS